MEDEREETPEDTPEEAPEETADDRNEHLAHMLDEIHSQLLDLREYIGEVKGAMDMFAQAGGVIREDEQTNDEEFSDPLLDPMANLDLNMD